MIKFINLLIIAIEKEKERVIDTLQQKYFIYDWFAIQLNTIEERDNVDFFPKENNHIMTHTQGNDKQLFAIYRPISR